MLSILCQLRDLSWSRIFLFILLLLSLLISGEVCDTFEHCGIENRSNSPTIDPQSLNVT